MFFLEKLCRICVETGAPLIAIDTVDFDLIRLSEKLEVCANLVISKDTVSSEICEKCVNKLRVSYHFLNMCKKSTKIIQGYLDKFTETKNNVLSSDLSIELNRLPENKLEALDDEDSDDIQKDYVDVNRNISAVESKNPTSLRRKQRITKEQRCSLLKQLLNKPKKERDKSIYYHNTYDYERGGLKNIIDFTKNYEFSFNLDKNSNIESTPLDKLTAFSTNYFRRDFSEFKTHVLHVIENQHEHGCGSDAEECMSDTSDENKECAIEEVLVEPDIKIKEEISDCEEDSQCPLDYLETSFDDEDQEEVCVKKEQSSDSENEMETFNNEAGSIHLDIQIKDEKIKSSVDYQFEQVNPSNTRSADYKSSLSINSSPAVKLLDRLVSNYPINSRKVFSPSNVRCRTRDQPYINPMLKNQFLYRSFKCERCNRYFKSQGYLKAHTSKVH